MTQSKNKSKNEYLGETFLVEVDEYVRKRLYTLKCTDIHSLYFRFFDILKKYRGNSNGFTGLSEYLIFRFLYHQLGGVFEQEEIPHSTLFKFISQKDEKLKIGQSAPISIYGKQYFPDIVIWYGNQIHSIIQIKIYPTNGKKEINRELALLKKLRRKYPHMLGLLLIFNMLPNTKRATIRPYLKTIKYENSKWFNFLILQNNNSKLHHEFQRHLKLKNICGN